MMAFAGLATACSDEMDVVIPAPDNVTFDELTLPSRFTHVIPDNGGFDVRGIHFNTVKSGNQLAGGFCYSNRSNRSFVWKGDETSVDSIRYSVRTIRPNLTGTYVVCHVNGDDATMTFDKPQTIDYMLVANTTWIYNAIAYGNTYGTEEKPVANPYVPSGVTGVWHAYLPEEIKKFGEGDYVTVTATGYKGGTQTGTTSFDLVCRTGHNTEHPTWNYNLTEWNSWHMESLGQVDKIVFSFASSESKLPAWFCLDGIQFKK